MAVTADSVVVEIEAKIDGYKASVRDAVGVFEKGASAIKGAAGQAEQATASSLRALSDAAKAEYEAAAKAARDAAAAVQKATGDEKVALREAARATREAAREKSAAYRQASEAAQAAQRIENQTANATRNIGRQFADVGAQLAGGQSIFLIAAQQAPQLADALRDIEGKAGSFAARAATVATFLSGPWGAAFLAAGTIVGVLTGKLLEDSDAQKEAKEAAKEHAAAVEALNDIAGVTAHTEEQRAAATLAVARADRDAAQAAITRATAQLALIDVLQSTPNFGGDEAAAGLANAGARAEAGRDAARKDLIRTRGLIDRANSEAVLKQYSEMFPLQANRFGKFVDTYQAPKGRTPRVRKPREKKPETLADRLKKDAEGDGPFISRELAAAGSDANALKVTLDSVDQSLAAIQTGLSGVDIGSILTEDEQRRLEAFSENFHRDLSSGLADALVSGRSLGDVLENSFKRAAAALIESGITDLIAGNPFGSGFGAGGIGGAIKSATSFLGFGRASGGPVSAGRMYRVNEGASPGRVEGFMPQGSGKIIPLGRMASAQQGGSTIVNRFNLDLRGALMTEQVLGRIEGAIQQSEARAVATATTIARKGQPGASARFNALGTTG
jgi:hypothetical protein